VNIEDHFERITLLQESSRACRCGLAGRHLYIDWRFPLATTCTYPYLNGLKMLHARGADAQLNAVLGQPSMSVAVIDGREARVVLLY
jgi:hypothetical protein